MKSMGLSFGVNDAKAKSMETVRFAMHHRPRVAQLPSTVDRCNLQAQSVGPEELNENGEWQASASPK